MTMKELSDAVRALVPKTSRLDVTLILRTSEPTSYRKETVEVLAEISVWHSGEYYGVDSPTYEGALAKFKAECLPEIFPPVPEPVAPAMDRLAEMEPDATSLLGTMFATGSAYTCNGSPLGCDGDRWDGCHYHRTGKFAVPAEVT